MFFTNEKEKILKDANLDLQLKIDSLNMEIKQLKSNISINSETINHNKKVLGYYEEQNVDLSTRILELEDKSVELEHKTKLAQKRQAEYHLTMKNEDKLIKELQTEKELKEKFETENTVLKSANKVLSEVNTKVQPIMDENIKLKSQLEYNVSLLSSKDETINDLKSQLSKNEEERVNLLQIITTFQTKDAQVVQAQVIQPSIIEPTVLSSKK